MVFGKAGTAPVSLSDVAAGTGGFVINGIDVNDRSGFSVSGAGARRGKGPAGAERGFRVQGSGKSQRGVRSALFHPNPEP